MGQIVEPQLLEELVSSFIEAEPNTETPVVECMGTDAPVGDETTQKEAE